MKDVIKGVIYDRGPAIYNGETRYMSLVAMVIASTEPIVTTHTEFIVMGSANVMEEIKKLNQYKCPHKFGDISNAIVETSRMIPDDLIGLDEVDEFDD
jgi:hypothetical protein